MMLDLEQVRGAARLCGTNRILRAAKLTGLVASAPGFNQQPLVMDAVSAVLVDLFGPVGQLARKAPDVALAALKLRRGARFYMMKEL